MKSLLLLVLAVGAAVLASHPKDSVFASAADPENILGRRYAFPTDTVVLARIEDRVITGFDVRRRYFDMDPMVRPRTDSAGRQEFFNTLVDREVIGLTALATDRELSFENRLELRRLTNTALQNALYRKLVTDSLVIRESDVREVMEQFDHELHLRSLLFVDRATAERVRRDLIAGRTTWAKAAKASKRPNDPTLGEMGWVDRTRAKGDVGIKTFRMAAGTYSEVFLAPEGFQLFHCLERRRTARIIPPTFRRTVAIEDLRTQQRLPYLTKFNESIRRFAGVVYDTANIEWTAARFREAFAGRGEVPAATFDMTEIMPTFAPADTGRVLARTRSRTISLGQFVYGYSTVPAMFRDEISSLEPFINAFDGPAFEDERLALARSMGLENDPEVKALVQAAREKILVDHVYQDSVVNHVNVTPEMRRRYYKEREREFVSFAQVRYARFFRPDSASAMALMARLKSGASAHQIMREDSLRGDDSTGQVVEASERDPDEYRKLLFEELRPGQVAKVGPDRDGNYLVFQSLHYEPVRQMKFEEVQGIVDESLQNLESERILKEFLARRRKAYRIELHPEHLARIEFTDPARDLIMKAQ